MKLSLRDDFVTQLGNHEIQDPAICASIIGRDLESMKKNVKNAKKIGAEVIELRLDKLEDTSGWEKLLQGNIATIVTNRSEQEGGYFEGSERERTEILIDAIKAGASCIDIELSTPEEKRDLLLETALENSTSTIASFHDFEKVPPIKKLTEKTKKIENTGCDFAKIIGFSKDAQDSLKILDFLVNYTEKNEKPIIAFAMGEKGKFTRAVAPLLGSPITYASIEEKTAPGQFRFSNLKEILEKYRN